MYAPYTHVTVLDKGLRGYFSDNELSFDPSLSDAEPERKEVGTPAAASKSWYESLDISGTLKTLTDVTKEIIKGTQGQGGTSAGTSGTSASASGTTDAAILAMLNKQNQSSNTPLYIGLGIAALAASLIAIVALRK